MVHDAAQTAAEKIGKKVNFDVNATACQHTPCGEPANLFFPFFPRVEKIMEKMILPQHVAGQQVAAREDLFFPRAEKIKSTQLVIVT